MEIQVSTSFFGPLTQNKFFVRLVDDRETREFKGKYDAGEWKFELFDEKKLILESRKVKLSKKETFLGHQKYEVFFEGKELAVLNKSYLKKEIIFRRKSYSFPKIFRPSIEELKLKFPLRTWISRSTVKSSTWASDIQEIMLAIAITIFIWFTWNAVPAD